MGLASVESSGDGGRRRSRIIIVSLRSSLSSSGKTNLDLASYGGQIEEPSGGGSSGDCSCSGIKRERA